MKEVVLVTGATGFIGKNLCKKLRSLSIDVIEFSSKDGDISINSSLDLFFNKGVTHLIHLAGSTFVPKSWEEPHLFLETNVLGTSTALDFCRKQGCSMTYISAYIYGSDVINPISENSPISPNNPYALSKKMGEDLCEFYNKYYSVSVNIIRPFNVYGPGQPEHFLIPFIIKQIKETNEVKVKDLEPKRDYIYIDDLIDCIVKAKDYKLFDVFNAGTGKSYSVKEIIEIALKLSDKKHSIISESSTRKNEISDTIADINNAHSKLKWISKISIEQGLSELLK